MLGHSFGVVESLRTSSQTVDFSTSRVPRERKKKSEKCEALPDGQALSHGQRLQNREGAQITENKTKETREMTSLPRKAFLLAKQNREKMPKVRAAQGCGPSPGSLLAFSQLYEVELEPPEARAELML